MANKSENCHFFQDDHVDLISTPWTKIYIRESEGAHEFISSWSREYI